MPSNRLEWDEPLSPAPVNRGVLEYGGPVEPETFAVYQGRYPLALQGTFYGLTQHIPPAVCLMVDDLVVAGPKGKHLTIDHGAKTDAEPTAREFCTDDYPGRRGFPADRRLRSPCPQ